MESVDNGELNHLLYVYTIKGLQVVIKNRNNHIGGHILKKVLAFTLFFLFMLVGCKSTSFINTKDNVDDKDEGIIKEFRSHQGYTNEELKNLTIKSLGTVDDYKIYYVSFKDENETGEGWTKEGYTFPLKSHTRIIGIKSDKLYTIGELIHETQINIKQLYGVLPEEFKIK